MVFGLEIRRRRKKPQQEVVITDPLQQKPRTLEDSVKAEIGTELLNRRYKEMQKLMWGVTETRDGKVKESSASEIFKQVFIASQGLAEIGDRGKISLDALRNFKKLLVKLANAIDLYGEEHHFTSALRKLVFGAYVELMFRSVLSRHTDINVVRLGPEYFMMGAKFGKKWSGEGQYGPDSLEA